MSNNHNKITNLESQVETLKGEIYDEREKIRLQKEEFDNENASLKITIKEQRDQLDAIELKKLAVAYEKQELVYKGDANFWAWWILGIILCFILSTIIAVNISQSKIWYERFEYYVVDLILLTALWFSSSQYSDFIKLRNDYANRKTLAQSFNNILNSLEDQDIKTKFIEKTTEILCTPITMSTKEPILSKEVLKQVTDLIKSVKSV